MCFVFAEQILLLFFPKGVGLESRAGTQSIKDMSVTKSHEVCLVFPHLW